MYLIICTLKGCLWEAPVAGLATSKASLLLVDKDNKCQEKLGLDYDSAFSKWMC